MKKVFSILASVLLTATVWAQSPEKISYQAVIRNTSNQLVTNQNVGMQISILQGSASGTAVYVETQTPTTNANGLVSIEIGAGTVVSGTFASIDWANGPYFIKTETDLAGGANYTITGTSQLLSVPYALHAKTAETVTGGITETDPLWTAASSNYYTKTNMQTSGQALLHFNNLTNKPTTIAGYGITDAFDGTWASLTGKPTFATVATSGSYNDLSDKPTIPSEADGSETKVIAGTNVTVTGAGTTANPYVINATGTTTLTIGQRYQGGIIFWLDATGQHGLIAATTDQSTGIQWYNGTYRYTGTTGDGLYAGSMNTSMIVATQMADNQTGNFAAKVCADYSVTDGGVTYGDWYLPSKYELNLLYLQKNAVGGFASVYYWSSSESNNTNTAWLQNFDNGYQTTSNKNYAARVRAIRAF